MSGFRLELKVPPVMLALLFACAMGFVAWICPWATVEIPQRIFLLCSQTLIYSPLPVTFLEYTITYNTVFQTAVTHFP